jgi:LPXTG-motif cell wall-anchored protein
MRKLAGWLAGAALVAVAVVASGPPAGAADRAACSFTVTSAGAGLVDIAGRAEVPDVFVKAFVNGSLAATTQADASGDFAMAGVHGSTTDTISVSYGPTPTSAYPTTSCDPVHVSSEVIVSPAQVSAASLAFTGSSDTSSLVLAGLAAALVGTVLVVVTRRRRSARTE